MDEDDDDHDDDDDDEGRFLSFKVAQNLICLSLEYQYIQKWYKLVHVKSLMGLKIW